MGATFRLLFGRVGAGDHQWLHTQLIAAEQRLPVAVLASADWDQAIIARDVVGLAPLGNPIQLNAPARPVDFVDMFLIAARKADALVVKNAVGSRTGFKTPLAV